MTSDRPPLSEHHDQIDWEALARYVAGESSDAERAEIRRWIAADPANADRVAAMLRLLADHMIKTARTLEGLPVNADPLTILDYCVQPRDVQPDK